MLRDISANSFSRHSALPGGFVAMIVEAVLREVYGGPRADDPKIIRFEDSLENLARFFESKRRKEAAGRS